MQVRRKIDNNIFLSMFWKLLLMFFIIGVLPLLLTGNMLYKRLAYSVEKTISVNALQIVQNFGVNIERTLETYNKISMYPYDYTTERYPFLYKILEDDSISEIEKKAEISAMISTILYSDSYISNVRFITDNKVYSVSEDMTKILDSEGVLKRQWKYHPEEKRSYSVLPLGSDNRYYYNSDQLVFTIARNYLDMHTISGAGDDVLGTIYLDIGPEQFGVFEQEIKLGENSSIGIYERSGGQCVYSRNKSEIGTVNAELWEVFSLFEGTSGTYQQGDMEYSFYCVDHTDWIVVAKVFHKDAVFLYAESSRYFILLLTFVSGAIVLMFYIFSRQITRPARTLTKAMEALESGNLNTRVDIHTYDEMEILGKGFNRMAENLQKYIEQVFLAEIRQKDAELDALKSAIKPHYLYNTLDVIRMSALIQKDELVADMLNSLSKQLHYLMGNHADLVTLREEVESIKDYFYIVQIRFENRFELEIDIDESCMDLYVLKLILQPIVENAVKHGLRPKQGLGKISIAAHSEGDCLHLTVMDDGVGMTDEQVYALQSKLKVPYEKLEEKSQSVGMKNVYDRIRMNYGDPYGYSIISMKGIGTIIKYHLPMIKERRKENESDNRR